MTQSARVQVHFDARLPHARWGPLFHVFRLEHPEVSLEWRPAPFPARDRPLLDGADVGLMLEPPPDTGVSALTLDISPMVVIVAAGDRLAHHDELSVADLLDRPFPGAPSLHPEWTAFWTLDAHRGSPPPFSDDDVRTSEDGLEVVAAGHAIATVPAWVAGGLSHPGVVAIPLREAPQARTSLVWHSGADDPLVRGLVDLAAAWVRLGRGDRL
jgi:DNA-binding transcriptional LysR family regulator